MADDNMREAPHQSSGNQCGAAGAESIGRGPAHVPDDVLWVVEHAGWPVFPVHGIVRGHCTCGSGECSSPGKHPRTHGGVKDATKDITVLNAWASRWPDTNWAMEPVGGLVVDIDAKGGGFASIEVLGLELPRTTKVVTGGGGAHLYFMLPEGQAVGNRVGWLPGVDARTTGGYVVLPGSRHASGSSYVWGDQVEPVTAPAGLIDAVRSRATSSETSGLAGTLALLDGVPEGQRDSTIFRACCRWWRQFSHHDDGGEAEVIARALEMARGCTPPFPDEWAVAKVESARRYAAEDPLMRLSDDGNALLFVEQSGDVVRYATDTKRWHAWDGRRWVPNAETVALDLARRTARSLIDFAKELESDDNDRARAMKHATISLSAGRIEAMPRLAKSDRRIAISAGDFDTHGWVLNTPTGTVDLRTGELYDHRRDDYLAKITNVGYDPNAEASYWQEWLLWAMNGRQDLVDFLQRAVGYAITGDTSEQVFFLLFGKGANGKTTFLNVMEQIIGDYAYHSEPDLLTPKDGAHPTGVADLHGRRFVVASETREGKKLDERTVKALTGQDTITARRLYQDFFSFTPTHKIFFAVNHRPNITDDSHAMWRRVLLVPWEMKVEPEDQIKDVAERIVRNEGAGVLRWAVEGARLWLEDGGLKVPHDVRVQTTEYRAREDTLGAFMDEYLIEDKDAALSSSGLWTAYETWCRTEGVSGSDKMGRNKLLQKFEDRTGAERGKVYVNGSRVVGYKGWRAVTEGPITFS